MVTAKKPICCVQGPAILGKKNDSNFQSKFITGDEDESRVKRATIRGHRDDSVRDTSGPGLSHGMGVPETHPAAAEAPMSVC